MKDFSSIVLSGGVFKAVSIIGVIKYLEDNHLIKNLKTLVGTSAGSVICFLLSIGFDSNEIKTFLMEILADESINQFDINNICNVFDSYSIDSSDKLERIFKKAIYKKLYKEDITFMEHAKIFGKHLIICVSNLTKEQVEYWSVDTHPLESVVLALTISCSIPLIFPPITYKDMLYVDGAIFQNFPISYFDDKPCRDVIGVNIKSKNYQKHDTFFNYLRFVIYSVIEKASSPPMSDLKKNIVTINFDDDNHEFSTDCLTHFKYIVPEKHIDKYISIGYDAIASLAKSSNAEGL